MEAEFWCGCGKSSGDHTYVCGRKLHDDWDKLLASEAGADVTFKLPEGEIKAHKMVLSARVEVFQRMFSSSFAESKTNRVDITDCDLETFKAFIRFLYCGRLYQPFDLYNLLALASKYMVPDLVCASVPLLKAEINASKDPQAGLEMAKKMMEIAKRGDFPLVTYTCEEYLIAQLTAKSSRCNGYSSYPADYPGTVDYAIELLILSHVYGGTRLNAQCLQVLQSSNLARYFSEKQGRLKEYPAILAQLGL